MRIEKYSVDNGGLKKIGPPQSSLSYGGLAEFNSRPLRTDTRGKQCTPRAFWKADGSSDGGIKRIVLNQNEGSCGDSLVSDSALYAGRCLAIRRCSVGSPLVAALETAFASGPTPMARRSAASWTAGITP